MVHKLLEFFHLLVQLLLSLLDIIFVLVLIGVGQRLHHSADETLGKLGVRVENLCEVSNSKHCRYPIFERLLGTLEFTTLDPIRRKTRPKPSCLILVDIQAVFADDMLDIQLPQIDGVFILVVRSKYGLPV